MLHASKSRNFADFQKGKAMLHTTCSYLHRNSVNSAEFQGGKQVSPTV